jgi:hypothetical protein
VGESVHDNTVSPVDENVLPLVTWLWVILPINLQMRGNKIFEQKKRGDVFIQRPFTGNIDFADSKQGGVADS